MIPVTLQPEPADFDTEVRQKGHGWLRAQGIALNAAPPKASNLPNYWSRSNKQLWEAYSGICAYLSIFFEWSTGAASTDHFTSKSQNAGDAYDGQTIDFHAWDRIATRINLMTCWIP
jgi:hypothetical protein